MSRLDDIDARLKARLDSANASLRSGADPVLPGLPGNQQTPTAPTRPFAPTDKLADLVGVKRLEGFSLKKFFSEVFKRHSDEEMEAIFTCGRTGTPSPVPEGGDGWPAPWIFSRVLAFTLLAYFAMLAISAIFFCYSVYFVVGLVFFGCFAVPFATVILFFELNVWRDISLFNVIKLLVNGGIVSLFYNILIRSVGIEDFLMGPLGHSAAGIIEEVAKLLAVVCLVRGAKIRHVLGALLLGAAVGAGFAAIESTGYALTSLNTLDSIHLRGVFSPFGHVVWTAIASAALFRVKGDGGYALDMFFNWRFLRLFLLSVILHMVWNCAALSLPFYLKELLLGFAAWAVVFSLVQEGLHETAGEKASIRGRGAMPDVVINGKKQTPGSRVMAALIFVLVTFATGFLIAAGGTFFYRVVLPLISGSEQ